MFFFLGYPTIDKKPVKSALEFFTLRKQDNVGGNYVAVHLKGNSFDIFKSKVSSQALYYSDNKAQSIIGTSPFMMAKAIGGQVTLDDNFMRWSLSYAVCCNNASLFAGVKILQPNEEIRCNQYNLVIEQDKINWLQNERLQQLYKSNPTAYWDEAFASLVSQLKVLDLTNDSIRFPISGGKDSRLLLGLLIAAGYKDRIQEAYTIGPQESPEVRSAIALCKKLGILHTVQNVAKGSARTVIFSDKLVDHIYISEGELSPMDMAMYPNQRSNQTVLPGQEGGLRNVAGDKSFVTKDDLLAWFNVHLGAGNKSELLTVEQAQKNKDEMYEFIDKCVEEGVELDEIPTLHRIFFRMSRWVSRVWSQYNFKGFAPFIFVSDKVIEYTYNAGAKSRAIEEFHFEMLRRIDPSLVSIPFANQSWSSEILARYKEFATFQEPLRWPEGTNHSSKRPVFEALNKNRSTIFERIEKSLYSKFSNLVNVKSAKVIFGQEILPHNYPMLWYLVMFSYMSEIDPDINYLHMRSVFPIDFEYSD